MTFLSSFCQVLSLVKIIVYSLSIDQYCIWPITIINVFRSDHQTIYCLKVCQVHIAMSMLLLFFVVISFLHKSKYHIIMAMIFLIDKYIMSLLRDIAGQINLSPWQCLTNDNFTFLLIWLIDWFVGCWSTFRENGTCIFRTGTSSTMQKTIHK